MSYTRSFHHSILVSGSQRVDYPASQHGGSKTVHYSQTVDMNININVDTASFDRSIDETTKNAKALTMSVVGMQGAQIAAIRKSTRQVSDCMVNGFYNLTHKDITGQKSEELAKLQASMGSLIQTAKALEDKHKRMDEDMGRMQRHYYTLFSDMDKSLQKRVQELDKPSFRIAREIRNNILFDPFRKEAASSVEQPNQTGKMLGLMTVARLQKKISDILSSISDYVENSVSYRKEVANTLEPLSKGSQEMKYVPAIFCEYGSFSNYNDMDHQVYLSDLSGSDQIRRNLNQDAFRKLCSSWKPYDQTELAQIDQAFRQFVEEASSSENRSNPARSRVYMEMLKLWQNNQGNMKCL